MIAADTSVWIDYLQGGDSPEAKRLEEALQGLQVVMPCVVLAELLSDPKLTPKIRTAFSNLPLLDVSENFWERVGELRRKILSKKLKSRLADAMIAQLCLDHHVELIALDRDFRHYAQQAGLLFKEEK
jgi:predicted nucleic acid-binding protein